MGCGVVAAALLAAVSALMLHPAAAQRPEANCTFTAPSGDFYDIRSLVVPGGDHRIEPDDPPGDFEFVYYWNSCGGVVDRGIRPGLQCDSSDVACQHVEGTDQYYSLGKLDTVQYVEQRPGFLVARYTGGSDTRQITVEIECDRDAVSPRFEMTSPTGGGLNYLLIVHSQHGCVQDPPAPPPPPPGNRSCTYSAPSGNRYNIARLINEMSDWRFTDVQDNYDYLWNSCQGLSTDVPPSNPSQDCSPGSNGTPRCGCRADIDVGCQLSRLNEGPFSLGTLDSGVYSEILDSDGVPRLSALYRNGAEVRQLETRSMRIDFVCSPTAEQPVFRISSPIYPDLEYRVTVESTHGCPIQDEDSCTLRAPDGSGEYNLGPLVGTTFTTNSTETPFPYDYYLGVCSPIRDELCAGALGDNSTDSASCQIIQNPDPGSDPAGYTFNNGVASNRTLVPLPGDVPGQEGVRIIYNDGEICDAPGAPRNPRLTFVDVYCTPDVDPPVLKYIAEAPPCTYMFAMETIHACKRPLGRQ